jgi:hypothetical protein
MKCVLIIDGFHTNEVCSQSHGGVGAARSKYRIGRFEGIWVAKGIPFDASRTSHTTRTESVSWIGVCMCLCEDILGTMPELRGSVLC